jgi:hypothetical protein
MIKGAAKLFILYQSSPLALWGPEPIGNPILLSFFSLSLIF